MPTRMAAVERRRESPRLPGVALPPSLALTGRPRRPRRTPRRILLVVPAQETEVFLAAHGADLPPAPLVLCAKGIDARTFALQTGIAAAVLPGRPLAALTGPGFAGEIARGLPDRPDPRLRRPRPRPQRCRPGSRHPRLRLYLTDDVTGAELGGALKNVVAIACGMVEGAGLGASARAALMTRGFAEMTRLAVAMGARAETLAGLSGLGDLSLTCNSTQSRNFARSAARSAPARPGPAAPSRGLRPRAPPASLAPATASSCRSPPPSPTCSRAARRSPRQWKACSRGPLREE